MRRGKSLVQVQVHYVYAEVARAHFPHQRVHVRAIHVQQTALGMHQLRNFVDLQLKHAERVGIGEHQRSHIFIHLRRECRHIHHATLIGF